MNNAIGELILEYQLHQGDEGIALELLKALVDEHRFSEAIHMLEVIRLDDIEFHLLEIKESLGMKEEPAQHLWRSLNRLANQAGPPSPVVDHLGYPPPQEEVNGRSD